ncbi:hypothetical protein KIPB_006634 [Kipferlia bialata]|uniref:Uncharacterized protein n=1 Tax=Kipferlia bialata TaxID=797122 RepID=A0A9K3CYT8_9EUKA|nr:hypothetical protein KIPB_006634 [Kipferlia bialata]|eukprot:g6634.t1
MSAKTPAQIRAKYNIKTQPAGAATGLRADGVARSTRGALYESPAAPCKPRAQPSSALVFEGKESKAPSSRHIPGMASDMTFSTIKGAPPTEKAPTPRLRREPSMKLVAGEAVPHTNAARKGLVYRGTSQDAAALRKDLLSAAGGPSKLRAALEARSDPKTGSLSIGAFNDYVASIEPHMSVSQAKHLRSVVDQSAKEVRPGDFLSSLEIVADAHVAKNLPMRSSYTSHSDMVTGQSGYVPLDPCVNLEVAIERQRTEKLKVHQSNPTHASRSEGILSVTRADEAPAAGERVPLSGRRNLAPSNPRESCAVSLDVTKAETDEEEALWDKYNYHLRRVRKIYGPPDAHPTFQERSEIWVKVFRPLYPEIKWALEHSELFN